MKNNTLRILFLIWVLFFLGLPCFIYYDLRGTFYDLGLYVNYAINFDITNPLDYGHLNFMQFPFHLLWVIVQNQAYPYLLLLLQSFFILISFYVIIKNCGKKLAVAFLFSYPILALNFNDFHYEFLCIFFIVLYFDSLINKKYIFAILFAFLVTLTKEVYFLLSLFMILNIYIEKKYLRKIDICIGFFIISFPLIIVSYYFFSKYNNLNLSINCAFEIIDCLRLLGLPYDFNNYFINFFSIQKFFQIFVPLFIFSFLPIFSKRILLAFPILLIILLSPHSGHSSLNSHYASILIPIYAFAAKNAIDNFKDSGAILKLYKYIVPTVSIVVAMLYLILNINYNWRFEFPTSQGLSRNITIKQSLDGYFSNKLGNSFCVQNNLVYFPILVGVISPFPACKNSNYIIIDMKRPLFLGDVKCGNNSFRCNIKDFEIEFDKFIIKDYVVKFDYDMFYILEKVNEND